MTACNVIRLWCDHRYPTAHAADGDVWCGGRFEVVARDAELARQAAAVTGWTHTGDEDFCPDHKPAAKEKPDD